MGGFSQMSAISELFLSTNRFKTIPLTKGSNMRYPNPNIAAKTEHKIQPEKQEKLKSSGCYLVDTGSGLNTVLAHQI